MSGVEKLETYIRYRGIIKWPLTLLGVWPKEESYWWYRLRAYVPLIFGTIIIMAIVNYLTHHTNNINVVIRVISMLMTLCLCVFKLSIITMNRGEVAVIHRNLENFCHEIMEDSRLIVPACKRISTCFYLSWLYIVTAWGCFFMILVILPFINMTMEVIKDPASAKYVLIFPTLYPWNTTSDGIPYRITYLFETLTAIACCLISTSIDNLILFYIYQVTSQLQAMSYRLNYIRKGESYDEIMITCTLHYVTIIECRNELQRIYGPIIFNTVGSSAVMMCTLMYQLCHATMLTKIQMFRIAIYIIAKSIQLLLFTWSGTLLHEESEKYLNDIYLSNWIETKNIRAVLITIIQRPLTIKACHVLISSVETFAKTMNTAISYFLLLRTIA